MIFYFERVSISVGVGNDKQNQKKDYIGQQFVSNGLAPDLLHSCLLQSL